MEKIGCKIICGAPTTLVVKGLMMMMKQTTDVRNNAARLVLRVSKTDDISPHLASLHSQIQYKPSSLCYNCLNSTAPDYLTELLRIYRPTRQLRSYSDTSILCIRTVSTHSLGQWSSLVLSCADCREHPPLRNQVIQHHLILSNHHLKLVFF